MAVGLVQERAAESIAMRRQRAAKWRRALRARQVRRQAKQQARRQVSRVAGQLALARSLWKVEVRQCALLGVQSHRAASTRLLEG